MSAIFKTLESIRKKLLDTTRRNRLINFNLNQKDCLRVVDELPNQLFDVLTNGKSMSFQAIPEPSRKQLIEKGYIAVNPETKKDEEIKPIPSAKQWAKEIGIDANFELPLTSSTEDGNDKHTDLDLQTLFYPYELDTRLKKIYQKVQSSINETGANILYLSIGYLEWNEGGNKNSFAPLLLIPVELEKGKLNIKKQVYEYKISYSEQNIVNNISLREKLKKDFGLSLPKFAEDSDPEQYLEEVKETILSKKPNWKIHRFVSLSLLNFSKLLMYLDLDPDKWPESANLSNHPLIGKLLGEIDSTDDGGGAFDVSIEPYPFDTYDDIHEKFPLVLDADSSQHSAIIDVINGRDTVIEGPPGTGKSQTIVNLIAAAINQGKSVLFVAEKQAALKVVHDRLNNIKLGDFCLNLWSHRSAKSNVFLNIQDRLHKYHGYPAYDISYIKEQYELQILKLNDYSDKINGEWGSTGYTLHEIFTKASRYQGLLNEELLNSILISEAGIKKKDVNANEILLTDYKKYYEQVLTNNSVNDFVSENPWYGFENSKLQTFQKEQLTQKLQDWQSRLIELQSFEKKSISDFSFYRLEDEFNKEPKITEDLDILDSDLSTIDFNFLQSIGPSNLKSIDKAFQSYKELCQRQIEIKQKHNKENFKSISKSADLLNITDRFFSKVNPNLTLKEVMARLEDLKNLNLQMVDIEGLLQPMNKLFNSNQNKVLLSSASISEVIKGINQLNSLKIDDIEFINHSLDNPGAEINLVNLTKDVVTLDRTYDGLSEIYKIDSMPDWQELSSLKNFLYNAGFFEKMGAAYKAAKSQLLEFRANPYVKLDQLLKNLPDAVSFKKDSSLLNSNKEYVKSFGNILDGNKTRLDLIKINVKWFEGLKNNFEANSQTMLGFKNISNDSLRELKVSMNNDLNEKLDSFESNLNDLGSVFIDLKNKPKLSLNGDSGLINLTLVDSTTDIEAINKIDAIDSTNLTISTISSMINDIRSFVVDCRHWHESFQSHGAPFSSLNLLEEFESDNLNFQADSTIKLAECIHISLNNSKLSNYLNEKGLSHEVLNNLSSLNKKIKASYSDCEKSFEEFNELANLDLEKWLSKSKASLEDVIGKNDGALKSLSSLEVWIDYIRQLKLLDASGLSNFAAKFEVTNNYEMIIDSYRSVVFNQIARNILITDDSLGTFSAFTHQNLQQKFIQADNELKDSQIKMISFNADSKSEMPFGNNSGPVRSFTEGSLLKHEANKKTRHISLRQLTKKAGNALKEIKPCFMMSPMSVAQYLQPGEIEFDIVIMDEASQLKPQYALGAIARGKQLVVVGDPKQLPPTNFFDKNDADEDEDELTAIEESESILDVAMGIMPLRRLTWHYRSRHQSLIAFSNYQFYNDTLKVFPSPSKASSKLGLHFSRLKGCLYSQGVNLEEAKIVAVAVKKHLLASPNETLGVIAFNSKQEKEIREQIEILAKEDKIFSRAYDKDRSKDEEPFFVKNIESVQGDERDIIFISMTYGPEIPDGPVYKRFNTGKSTFWRRLNVLFTRAKSRMQVFSSYGSDDIDNAQDKGMIALNGFLKYCETKKISRTVITNKEPDSDFEISVMELLNSHNYDCVPQVGEAGFFIDIAVKDPNIPGKFLMAVECDGATYHSSKTARDRDRLRQQILEGYGWNVKRIWSTDWFNDKNTAIKPIINELKKLSKASEIEMKKNEAESKELESKSLEIKSTEKSIILDEVNAVTNSIETINIPESPYLTININLIERLNKFNNEVIKKEFPKTDEESRLLKPSMVEALNHYKPTNKEKFLELVPSYIRMGSSPDEAKKYLDSVLNIINSSLD
jgi:hypothetical protein